MTLFRIIILVVLIIKLRANITDDIQNVWFFSKIYNKEEDVRPAASADICTLLTRQTCK